MFGEKKEVPPKPALGKIVEKYVDVQRQLTDFEEIKKSLTSEIIAKVIPITDRGLGGRVTVYRTYPVFISPSVVALVEIEHDGSPKRIKNITIHRQEGTE